MLTLPEDRATKLVEFVDMVGLWRDELALVRHVADLFPPNVIQLIDTLGASEQVDNLLESYSDGVDKIEDKFFANMEARENREPRFG
jgi:hypothetical protein